ncbi:MAG: S26 family signal peptidase [Phycisphaerales bacterium]|jgi:signal peptidase I
MPSQDARVPHARAGRWPRRLQRAGWGVAIALLLTIGVRSAVAQVYVVPTAAIEPEIPRDSRVLVYKLASRYQPGQIVAYHHAPGIVWLGRVESFDPGLRTLTISRNGTGPVVISKDVVVGRVVLGTR